MRSRMRGRKQRSHVSKVPYRCALMWKLRHQMRERERDREWERKRIRVKAREREGDVGV